MPSGEVNVRKTHCPLGHEYTGHRRRSDRSGRVFRYCRECDKLRAQRKRLAPDFKAYEAEKMRRWRAEHREEYLAKAREDRRAKKAWLDSQKVKCCRCDETHPACMDFHHRDPSQKDGNLSQMVAKVSLEKLKEEVAKCDILCANCHRKLHWDEKSGGA